MKTACPSCGAEIEFRYDDSFVRVCDHCHAAVARTDRGVDSLGKVADLVPIDSPLRLFAEGHLGSTGFLLVGMAQIRHPAGGIWQEWYAKLDGGKWGWLAEAQGRYYLTFAQEAAQLPDIAALQPGSVIELPVGGASRSFTVAEHAEGTYGAATGELPYRLVPDTTFRYVDLDDGGGTFATIDYGEPGDPPALYVGQQVTLDELGIRGGEAGPSGDRTITSKRLACPSCNAPIELRAPDSSQRVVCAYCNQLIALDGELRLLGKLASKAQPSIPLGKVGRLPDGELTVIGYLQRSACVEGVWYPFEEYLLHAPEVGFRWLVCSDGHWSYAQPVAPGAVTQIAAGCEYDGVTFRAFATAPLRVDQVLGEMYWQVQAGEQVESEDFIAPPAMLSLERTKSEETWSLSTYLTPAEVAHAFGGGDGLVLGAPVGVGANQVNASVKAGNYMLAGFGVMVAIGLIAAIAAPARLVYQHAITVHGNGAAAQVAGAAVQVPALQVPSLDVGAVTAVDPCSRYLQVMDAAMACDEVSEGDKSTLVAQDTRSPAGCATGLEAARAILATTSRCAAKQLAEGTQAAVGSGSGTATATATGPGPGPVANAQNVFFSDPFQLDGRHNVEIAFSAQTIDNDWVYVAADLVNQQSGSVVDVDADLEHWSGVEDGEAWSEGSRRAHDVIGPQPAGAYVLRLEGQRGKAGDQTVDVTVREGVFRGAYLAWALALLGIPWLAIGLHGWSFEKRRWENSTTGKPPVASFSIVVALAAGLGLVIFGLFKLIVAIAQGSDD